MMRIALTIIVLGTTLLPGWALANRTNLSRQQIRSMSITERPSRPGHVYGNTVRRVSDRRVRR